jgi:hypothetical protein
MGFRGAPARLSELVADLITGAIYRSRESGERLELNTDPAAGSSVKFFTGEAGETSPATISVDKTTTGGDDIYGLRIRPPALDGEAQPVPAVLVANKDLSAGGTSTLVQLVADEITANGYPVLAARQIGKIGIEAGALTEVWNTGAFMTVYQALDVAVPAGAKMAMVVGRARARAGANAAGFWRLQVYGIEDEVRVHNETDPYQDMGATLMTLVQVFPDTIPTLDLYITGLADTGGTAIDTRVGGFTVTWFG